MQSDIKKYFTNKQHLQKRIYERFGNYLSYIKRPQRIPERYAAKKYAHILAHTHGIEKLHSLVCGYEQYNKYRDYERYLAINFRRIFDLGLDKQKGLDVFDIGCGGGFFLGLSRVYGHNPYGLDIGGIELYDKMIEFLEIPRQVHHIKPQEAMPSVGKRFDLITAFAICFHKTANGVWGPEDWNFFLKDLEENFAKKGARLHLFFNNDPHGDFMIARDAILESGYKPEVGHKTVDIYFD